MDKAPKSAFELAMERLRKKDADEGVVERPPTAEQKAAIAEIRNVYAAKLAQQDILHQSNLATTWAPEERQKLEDENRREVQRLNEERDRKIQEARESGGSS